MNAICAAHATESSTNASATAEPIRADGGGAQDAAKNHRIVGMTNSAPSLIPEGQRAVTVFVLV